MSERKIKPAKVHILADAVADQPEIVRERLGLLQSTPDSEVLQELMKRDDKTIMRIFKGIPIRREPYIRKYVGKE